MSFLYCLPQDINKNSISVEYSSSIQANRNRISLPSLWVSTTTYNHNNYVLDYGSDDLKHKFKALNKNDNTNKKPKDEPLFWSDLGVINEYKFLDKQINTKTVSDTDTLLIKVRANRVNSISLLNLNAYSITVSIKDGEKKLSEEEVNLENKILIKNPAVPHPDKSYWMYTDWFDYFYEEPILIKDLFFNKLPFILRGEFTITLKMPNGNPSIGMLILANAKELGNLLVDGLSFGIKDYSKRFRNEQGLEYSSANNYSKRHSFNVDIDTNRNDDIYNLLSENKDKYILFVGSTKHSSLINYGTVENFDLTYKNSRRSNLSLKLLGLI